MARWADLFARILRGDAPPPPVATLVGFSLVSVAPGRAVFAMEARPEHGDLVECTITDDQGRLVARASSTCLTVREAEEGAPASEEGER